MAFKIMDAGGVIRTIGTMKVQDGAVLRQIVRAKVMDGSTLRTVATFTPPISLAITPPSEDVFDYISETLSTDPMVAAPTGGLGPYTYLWSIISGTGTISAPTSATTSIGSSILVEGEPEYVTVRCVVTDVTGQTASADAEISFLFFNPGGGH